MLVATILHLQAQMQLVLRIQARRKKTAAATNGYTEPVVQQQVLLEALCS